MCNINKRSLETGDGCNNVPAETVESQTTDVKHKDSCDDHYNKEYIVTMITSRSWWETVVEQKQNKFIPSGQMSMRRNRRGVGGQTTENPSWPGRWMMLSNIILITLHYHDTT